MGQWSWNIAGSNALKSDEIMFEKTWTDVYEMLSMPGHDIDPPLVYREMIARPEGACNNTWIYMVHGWCVIQILCSKSYHYNCFRWWKDMKLTVIIVFSLPSAPYAVEGLLVHPTCRSTSKAFIWMFVILVEFVVKASLRLRVFEDTRRLYILQCIKHKGKMHILWRALIVCHRR